MYKELYQYFIIHKRLHLPGIGTLQLERRSAEVDFVGKVVRAPVNVITLHHGSQNTQTRIFQWLGASLRIGESEAVMRFNDFVAELRAKILSGNRLEWDGIGTLSRGLAGEIRFEPAIPASFSESVPASKVLRENAEHNVRVGEQEKTSAEMIELLQPVERRRNYAWVLSLILIVIAVLFIGWYFIAHGVNPEATGNNSVVSPQDTPASKVINR